MKKRLLITSIVMMLVVAVALSTATYAWFTSSATATANEVSLTAAVNDAPSLGISWVDGNYDDSIDAASPNGETVKFQPAAPATLWTDTTTGDNAHTQTISTVTFTTSKTSTSNGDMVFNGAGTSTPVYTWTDNLTDGHTSFFIKNLSPANAIPTITMTATIDGAGKELIRVGVFKKGATNYELLGVLANKVEYSYTAVTGAMNDSTTYYKLYLGKYVVADMATDDGVEGTTGEAAQVTAKTADYYDGMTAPEGKFFTRTGTANTFAYEAKAVYGAIESGASVNAMKTVDCVSSIDITGAGDTGAGALAAQGTIELVVLVWEDAVALGDVEQGRAATIQLNFNAA